MASMMRQQLRLQSSIRAPCCSRTRLVCRARASGGMPSEPFNESAAQVKRLVQRDRKEFLGNEIDILDKFEKEFGEAAPSSTDAAASTSSAASTTSSSSSTAAAAPAPAAAAKPASPFASAVTTSFTASKSAPASSPFGGSPSIYKKSVVEPQGLSPTMSPDPLVKPAPGSNGSWISRITLTQVVLVCTFSSAIALMLATFSVVVNTGAVRLAGI